MSLGLIIQARVGSTRLPNKVLLPFYKDKNILELLIERLLNKYKELPIVLATTEQKNDNAIESIAKNYGISCFRGDENDVLIRFIKAAEKFDLKSIIRICSDNPFIDIESFGDLINSFNKVHSDYIGFKIVNDPSIITHFGFWGELTTLNALKRIASFTNDNIYREHVTNYIYTHPDLFNITLLEVDKDIENRNDIRLTIDTVQDFSNSSNLYSHMKKKNIPFIPKKIIEQIDLFPKMKQSMLKQILNNSK